MAVIEAGVVAHGLPILQRKYHYTKGDTVLRAGLFEAISQFAKETFGDNDSEERQEFKMRNFQVYFRRFTVFTQDELLLYAISDNVNEAFGIYKALDKIERELINNFEVETGILTTFYGKYFPIFDKSFKDLVESEEQRIGRLF